VGKVVHLSALALELNGLVLERERLERELLKEQAGKMWQWVHVRTERLVQVVAEIKRLEGRVGRQRADEAYREGLHGKPADHR